MVSPVSFGCDEHSFLESMDLLESGMVMMFMGMRKPAKT